MQLRLRLANSEWMLSGGLFCLVEHSFRRMILFQYPLIIRSDGTRRSKRYRRIKDRSMVVASEGVRGS